MRRIDLKKAQAARPSTIRDINRQIVLNYVRDREPISRADIARETDLQRSTISTIVEDLKTLGLIEEIGEGESTGGRRPTLLRLRAAGATAVGVDLTPSGTTVAASDLAGRVLDREELPSNVERSKLIELICDAIRRLAARSGHRGAVEGVGVSLPGLVDPLTGRAIGSVAKTFKLHNILSYAGITKLNMLRPKYFLQHYRSSNHGRRARAVGWPCKRAAMQMVPRLIRRPSCADE